MSQTMTQDEAAYEVIEKIYLSTVIPESHKDQYVEYIQKNGFNEKMLAELDKFFTQEVENAEATIAESQRLLDELNQEISQEISSNDETKAQMLNAFTDYAERSLQVLESEVDETEQDFEALFEVIREGDEQSEIEALQSRIKNQ